MTSATPYIVLSRRTLWKIMGSYGIPNKIINLVKCCYNNFECSVILGNNISENISFKSGVKQGCILSTILFLVTIDWIQRKTTGEHHGIQWTMFRRLEGLDFADDIADRRKQLFSTDMQKRLVSK